MKDAKVVIYSRKEWINIVFEFYEEMIKDNIHDAFMSSGVDQYVPKCILQNGIATLNDQELVEVMDGPIELMGEELGTSHDGILGDLVAYYFVGINGQLVKIVSLDHYGPDELDKFIQDEKPDVRGDA